MPVSIPPPEWTEVAIKRVAYTTELGECTQHVDTVQQYNIIKYCMKTHTRTTCSKIGSLFMPPTSHVAFHVVFLDKRFRVQK